MSGYNLLDRYFSGAHETDFTGHCVWSHDAHTVMEKVSHLKLITMSLLQTCSYVSEQMHMEVTIDVNKFLEAFSIKAEGGRIHPPSWTQHKTNSPTISQSPPIPLAPQTSQTTASLDFFSMDDYRQCRRAEALRWIDLQEKRSSVIARFQPTTHEEYERLRNAVKADSGPFRRKGKKQAGKNNLAVLYQTVI